MRRSERIRATGAMLFLCCMLGLERVHAVTLAQALPRLGTQDYATLRAASAVKGLDRTRDMRDLVSEGSLAHERMEEQNVNERGFTVMSVNFIPYPPSMLAMDDRQRLAVLFNAMRGISTQEGLTYISHRSGDKRKTLIKKSHYVVSTDDRSEVPDPVSESVSAEAAYVVYQKDTSFSGNLYLHRYQSDEDEISVRVENLDPLWVFGICKVADRGALQLSMTVRLLDEGVLLTAMAGMADCRERISFFGFAVDIPDAFSRRIDALVQWFSGRLASM